MARFKGYLKGQRGEVTRLGSANSGMSVCINGWDTGIEVRAAVIDGEDVFYIYKTGGSNHGGVTKIAEVNTKLAEFNDMVTGVYFD